MFGLMQEHSCWFRPDRTCGGLPPRRRDRLAHRRSPIHRCTYPHPSANDRQRAGALACSATELPLAWNGYRHMELHFGVSGTGAVLHAVTPYSRRLNTSSTAEDGPVPRPGFVALKLLPAVDTVRVRGDDRAHMRMRHPWPAVLRGLLGPNPTLCVADFDEHRRLAVLHLRHHGMPRGVLYSHRSGVLRLRRCTVDSLPCRGRSRIAGSAVFRRQRMGATPAP